VGTYKAEGDVNALSQLEAELLSASLNQSSHAESERQAVLSYIESLRRLQEFSERYFIQHYVENESLMYPESYFLL
jgi:hypothetical protein